MSVFKKTMIYLGLGPDEEYEVDDSLEPERPERRRPAPRPAPEQRPAVRPAAGSSGTVRPIASPAPEQPTVVAVPADTPPSRPARPSEPSSAVRTIGPATSKPHAVSPSTFNDAQEIGDRFKAGQPVIVNLQDADRDLRRRLVDFASGLCYALSGKMDRVAEQVYLLTPADVEVSREETRRALD